MNNSYECVIYTPGQKFLDTLLERSESLKETK